MATNFFLSNYAAQLEGTALNVASCFGGATLTVYNGTQPANANTALSGQTALAIFTLPAAGSNTVANNTVTFGTIGSVSAVASGTATWFRVTNGANVIFDGAVGTSGSDLNINSVVIASGATVSISSFIYTINE